MHAFIGNIPLELRAVPAWLGWKYGPPDATGNRSKLPIDPRSGRAARINSPATWASFDAAAAGAERFNLEGVGFVFAEGTGFAGIDFDDCLTDGVMAAEAAAAAGALDSYTEVSPSGNGVKVICRGRKPDGAGCKVENVMGCSRVEVYDRGRYFAMTGRRWPGAPAAVADRQSELATLCASLWPESRKNQMEIATGLGEALPGKLGADGGAEKITATPMRVKNATDEHLSMDRIRKYLERMPDAVSGQRGHDRTLAAACACFRLGASEEEAAELMAWFNSAKCKPPWTPGEIVHKLADARAKVAASGRMGEMRPDQARAKGKPWHNSLPAWIRDIKLRPYQKIILQNIADRCDRKPDAAGGLGGATIGYEALAKDCGMCGRTAKRHVQRLVSMGLLVKAEVGGINFRNGQILANVYKIPGALDGVTNLHTVHPLPTGL